MSLQPNTQLQSGKYRIVRFISSGGFGCTYEAEHTMLHKRVAIKEFFPRDFCNRDSSTNQMVVGALSKKALIDKLRGKFIDEAQAISQMKHPNIVSVSDIFEENGTAYYVMDFIDGQSLSDMVNTRGHLSEAEAKKYILQVADALKYVHSLNRLHLDIKPANIMVDGEDKAILIDFGTSKQYDELDGENTSTIVGNTPGYAPIEQIGNDVVKFTPATDIYSLGATFYKLLTGTTPPGANLLASGEELTPIPDTISPNVRKAITQAMQTNKNKRLQSIENFLGLLVENVSEETELDLKNNIEGDHITNGQNTENPTLVFDENVQIALELCSENDVNLALSGDVNAQNSIGCHLLQKDQYGASFYWFQLAAEQRYALAQYNLGLCFGNGYGVEENLQEAFSLYLKSAVQGCAVAQYEVGVCYATGCGVDKNMEKAFFWYLKSAKQGNSNGQYETSECYRKGIGISKNDHEAEKWFKVAADNGSSKAKYIIKQKKRVSVLYVVSIISFLVFLGIIVVDSASLSDEHSVVFAVFAFLVMIFSFSLLFIFMIINEINTLPPTLNSNPPSTASSNSSLQLHAVT